LKWKNSSFKPFEGYFIKHIKCGKLSNLQAYTNVKCPKIKNLAENFNSGEVFLSILACNKKSCLIKITFLSNEA
jgi:phage FluMu protein Com